MTSPPRAFSATGTRRRRRAGPRSVCSECSVRPPMVGERLCQSCAREESRR